MLELDTVFLVICLFVHVIGHCSFRSKPMLFVMLLTQVTRLLYLLNAVLIVV